MTLSQALLLTTTPAGKTTWDVPDGWQQGRGAFGGLTLAALAKVASGKLASPEIPGVVDVGASRLDVMPLREGHALSAVTAQLVQRGSTVAHAVASFGRTREVPFDRAPSAPRIPAFDDARVTALGPDGPTFARHFEYRVVRGMPFSGDEHAVTEGWVRLLDPGNVPSLLALIAMVDAWFPSVLPTLRSPRPFATISFAAHLFDRSWSPGEPLFHRSRLLASQQGYFAEFRELFTARGELCATNQQTMAIIK
jgi:acyl-CoA thioesterase